MTTRVLDLRITAAQRAGFVVMEAGEIVAAFTTAAELAMWVETRAREIETSQIETAGSGGVASQPFDRATLDSGPQATGDTGQGAREVAGRDPARDLPAVVLRSGEDTKRRPWLQRVTG